MLVVQVVQVEAVLVVALPPPAQVVLEHLVKVAMVGQEHQIQIIREAAEAVLLLLVVLVLLVEPRVMAVLEQQVLFLAHL